MTYTRKSARVLCAIVAGLLMTAGGASAAVASLPLAKDGALCRWGAFSGGPIGMVLPTSNAPDIPGSNGNEIDQVYRIFGLSNSLSRRERTFFVGWLLRSHSGEYDFVPKGVNGALLVKIKKPNGASVNAWLSRMNEREPRAFAGDLAVVTANRLTEVVFAPCFKERTSSKR